MATATIIDTETTGIEEPDVIELAWMHPIPISLILEPEVWVESRRFKPRKPISLGALATHHILDEDLETEPDWPGKWMPPGEYLIGHNVDFDWKAIGSPPMKRICTLALARSLWPELDSHSLGALTYRFTDRPVARTLLKQAHGAGRDVELCCAILVEIMKALPDYATTSWEEVWRASERARVPTA